MNAEFSVVIEPGFDLIHIEMGGFFSTTDISAFRFALETRMGALTCGPNQHLTLCDISAMKIQTQDIVGAFSHVVGDAKFRSRRLAFVTGSSLSRMQAKRLTEREGVAFFTDVAAARDWLLSGDPSTD